MSTAKQIDKMAQQLRMHVRKLANLPPAWDEADEGMKDWYRMLARRCIESNVPDLTE